MNNQSVMLTPKQCASELEVSEQVIIRAIKNKHLRAFRVGRQYRIKKDDWKIYKDWCQQVAWQNAGK